MDLASFDAQLRAMRVLGEALTVDGLQSLVSELLVLELLHESVGGLVRLGGIVVLLGDLSNLRVVMALEVSVAFVLGQSSSLLARDNPTYFDEIVLSTHRVLLLLF